jgi:hypothetical protein
MIADSPRPKEIHPPMPSQESPAETTGLPVHPTAYFEGKAEPTGPEVPGNTEAVLPAEPAPVDEPVSAETDPLADVSIAQAAAEESEPSPETAPPAPAAAAADLAVHETVEAPKPAVEAKTGDDDPKPPAPADRADEPVTAQEDRAAAKEQNAMAGGASGPPEDGDHGGHDGRDDSGDDERGEEPELTPTEIRARSLAIIDQELEEVRTANAVGQFIDTAGTVAHVLADQAAESAQAGDIAAADRKIDSLLDLEGQTELEIVKACYKVGSERSLAILRDRLEMEKITATTDRMEDMSEAPDEPLGVGEIYDRSTSSELFSLVVTMAHAEPAQNPQEWIERYGIDDAHKLELEVVYGTHLLERAQRDEDERAVDESMAYLAGKVDSFVDNHELQPLAVRETASVLLERLPVEELRQQVLERYLEAAGEDRVTLRTYEKHMNLTEELLNDRALTTTQNIDAIEEIVNKYSDELRDAGVENFEIDRRRLVWDTHVQALRGDSPAEVITASSNRLIELVGEAAQRAEHDPDSEDADPDDLNRDFDDEVLHRLFAIVYPDDHDRIAREEGSGSGMNINQEFAVGLQQNALQRLATYYARTGNFVYAREYIAALTNADDAVAAMSRAADAARRPEDIADLEQSELEVLANPRLDLHLQVAKARLSGDTDQMLAMGLTFARSVDTRNITEFFTLHKYLETLFISVQGTPHEMSYARQVVDILRQHDVRPFYMRTFSEALIRGGDPEEPRLALQHIMGAARQEQRISDLWRFARFLQTVQ